VLVKLTCISHGNSLNMDEANFLGRNFTAALPFKSELKAGPIGGHLSGVRFQYNSLKRIDWLALYELATSGHLEL